MLANPETGETHRVERGEAVWFGPDTWHHGVSYGTETLRVLEFFAPPPATGSSQPYANTKPYLSTATYVQNDLLGAWPAAAAQARERHTQHVLRQADVLWRLEGTEHELLVGILLSTDQLTCGAIELLPGQRSDVRVHAGDCAGYASEGPTARPPRGGSTCCYPTAPTAVQESSGSRSSARTASSCPRVSRTSSST